MDRVADTAISVARASSDLLTSSATSSTLSPTTPVGPLTVSRCDFDKFWKVGNISDEKRLLTTRVRVAEADLAVVARARGVGLVLFAGAVATTRAAAALGRALGPGVPGGPDGAGPGGEDGHWGWGRWDAH